MKRISNQRLPGYVTQVGLTPLLDLVLILLLVFMVAVPLLKKDKKGPLSASAPERPPEPSSIVDLVIAADQTTILAGEKLSSEAIVPAVRKRLVTEPDLGILVRVPESMSARQLTLIMDTLQRAGLRHTRVEMLPSVPKP